MNDTPTTPSPPQGGRATYDRSTTNSTLNNGSPTNGKPRRPLFKISTKNARFANVKYVNENQSLLDMNYSIVLNTKLTRNKNGDGNVMYIQHKNVYTFFILII